MAANNKTALQVSGMDCVNCATSVTRFLERKGLQDVQVNFSTGEVRFTQPAEPVSLEVIRKGISKLGYQVEDPSTGRESGWSLERKLLLAVAFTLPLLLHHLLGMVFGMDWLPFLNNYWVQFAICLPVYTIGFLHFGRSAWGSLRGGVPNMDVLIFLGSTAAFVYSLIGTFLQEPAYIFYETAATIITLVLLGNWLEKRSVKQTTSAIDDLSRLRSEKARKVTPSGTIVSLDQSEIQVGDLLQVNEGDQVPTDGRITNQHGLVRVDESMLTGESMPVEKETGDELIGGSLLLSGSLQMEVTATGDRTVLSQMIELVKTAQHEKPDIQRLADRISAIFVPVVVGIALLTFALGHWVFGLSVQQALLNAIAVLVISCPCAMGLATPTAVMVGVGRMAREGILVKGGQTLEVFAGIRNFIFDKTGTLTTGNFQVTELESLNGEAENNRAILLAMEQRSSHPIARAITDHLIRDLGETPLPELAHVEEQKGMGLIAKDDSGNTYRVGSARFTGQGQDEAGMLYLTKNDQAVLRLRLEDEPKPDAAHAVDYLKKKGKKTILLSGDRRATTEKMAQLMHIDTWYAEKLPEEKLAIVEELNRQAPTAMVGDGINDAPALAKATIGVSLSEASRVAIQSAQIVLLKGKLSALTRAVGISEQTLLTIKQNLFWAFAYNVVAIPIAAMGYLNPMWGAFFMAFSDIVVIGNSIRLKGKRIR